MEKEKGMGFGQKGRAMGEGGREGAALLTKREKYLKKRSMIEKENMNQTTSQTKTQQRGLRGR